MSEPKDLTLYPISGDTGISPDHPGAVVRRFVDAKGQAVVIVVPPEAALDEARDLIAYAEKIKANPRLPKVLTDARTHRIVRDRPSRLDS